MTPERMAEFYAAIVEQERQCIVTAKEYAFEGMQSSTEPKVFDLARRRMEDRLLAARIWAEARKLLQRFRWGSVSCPD